MAHSEETAAPADASEQQPQDVYTVTPETKATEDTSPPMSEEEAPPLPNEEAPPLPNELPPAPVDDGWDALMDSNGLWYFYNRYTGVSQYENPRVPQASLPHTHPAAHQSTTTASNGPPGSQPSHVRQPVAGGYNPAIHGDYDPNADYAQETHSDDERPTAPPPNLGAIYAAVGSFNRFTGKWQAGDKGPELHNDENKSKRQMNAFFDVDAAANSHDGRSLKAERQQKKLSKQEVKAFKEKRRTKKEERRRAWLMD